ncbi:MAG: precorrin-6y C5,15-methyltransferase (decarboxylating) subunit CbiE, partial [Lachnospiraceae bacterium]|nr:precorrin-6y C5,15-methyltransferase (decarboxylating) subunit CbiE [Lachnospiraceae bacterium]
LHVFTECISDKSRLFARVLPSAEVIASCRALGLEGKQICAMQGPFSAEINAAMLKQTKSAFLVTKESGASGGFPEKMEAVRECQITAVIIRRPKEDGADWEKVRATIDRVLDDCAPLSQMTDESPDGGESVNIQRRISCIGIGMGTPETLTREAAKEICEAQVIFGAKRILDSARALLRESADGRSPLSTVMEYNAQKIYDWLEAHPQVRRAAILMSGDVGFYSGARQVAEVFPAGEVRYYCGISSIAYFASKIPTSWQDAKLLSAHGKELALLNYVKKYPKIILLVGGAKDVERLCRELCDGGMDQVRVTTGSNLSYPEEMVRRGSPADFLDLSAVSSKDKAAADLYIMMVENPDAGEIITPGIPDEKFVRGKVPMTKEEIRALSVAKLRLKEDSVIYDIGAGTGSVSAECARLCTAGKVYAIERNPEGIALIRENGKKIGVSNLVPIEGTAPDAMRNLPAPTHAFIGGTSGSMREIIETLLEKNPSIRIVINTVTLESIAEVTELVRKMGLEDADIVQISAAKSRTLGGYHMMTAHNPVYIVSFGG